MVQPKSRKIVYFIAFLLPCFVLFMLFFIYPFIKGFTVSLTNWDGLTPRVPNFVEKTEFEDDIISKIKKQKDIEFIEKIFTLNASNTQYTRLNISTFERMKLTSIFNSIDYYPEKNRPVGFENYKKIFTGQIKDDFYPRTITQTHHEKTSDNLPARIEQKDFETIILPKLSENDQNLVKSYYLLEQKNKKGESFYKLNSQYALTSVKKDLKNLPESIDGSFTDSQRDMFLRSIKLSVLDQNKAEQENIIKQLGVDAKLSAESQAMIKVVSDRLEEFYTVSALISDTWITKTFRLGVVGFTLFFAFFSVIGINLVAFALALVLDSNIKGQKVLRTIFFLPNVLSMVIVALLWSTIFSTLLPKLTGVELWLSDAAKAPWLLVLIAIWQGCGYYMIVYLAGLQNIPTDVVEAAYIDGVTPWQKFRYITLPLLLPAITISLFLTIANALKCFDLMYAIIGSSGRSVGIVPYVYDIYADAFSTHEAGMANAKAMILFIVILGVTGLQLFLMKRKEIEQ